MLDIERFMCLPDISGELLCQLVDVLGYHVGYTKILTTALVKSQEN